MILPQAWVFRERILRTQSPWFGSSDLEAMGILTGTLKETSGRPKLP
jgi:hypothetical protein